MVSHKKKYSISNHLSVFSKDDASLQNKSNDHAMSDEKGWFLSQRPGSLDSNPKILCEEQPEEDENESVENFEDN